MNDVFKDLILPTDEEVKRETYRRHLSEILKGRPNPRKGIPTDYPNPRKGKTFEYKEVPAISKAKKGKPSKKKGYSAYTFFSNRGTFNNIHELAAAHPETSIGVLKVWALKGRNGFSKEKK
jgi:hypothetical protein